MIKESKDNETLIDNKTILQNQLNYNKRSSSAPTPNNILISKKVDNKGVILIDKSSFLDEIKENISENNSNINNINNLDNFYKKENEIMNNKKEINISEINNKTNNNKNENNNKEINNIDIQENESLNINEVLNKEENNEDELLNQKKDENNENQLLNLKRKSSFNLSDNINNNKIIINNNNNIKKIEEEKKIEIKLSERINLYDNPYDKLAFLSKEIGFETVIDYIINIINNNPSNSINFSFCDDIETKALVKDILKELTEEALYAYLMKILAIEQKENIEIITDFKLSLDSKLRSRATIQSLKMKKKFEKKKQFDLVMNPETQYRSKHFYNINGAIYCYIPKHNIKSSKCFLYCSKIECKAKLYLDMTRKKGRVYGRHTHRGVDVDQYSNEFPEIKDEDDWEHIQYDVKDKK